MTAFEDDDAPTGVFKKPSLPSPLALAPPEVPVVMTVDELARLLRVNRKTAYEAVARGLVPGARKLGRSIRINREAVLLWLRGQECVLRSSTRRTR
jgi:excisionase family DNA binding protein